FFNKKELEDLRAKEKAQKLEAKGSEDIIFTDKKGKEHTLTKETQKAWLEAFNLKSLDEEAIVEIPADLKERLGKEIKLNKKDFEKLMKNKREKYIPQIKETFKEPEAVFIDENDDLIFTKTFNDKLFFVNVNRDYGEAFKALSLAPKKNNNLLNKLNKAKEILKLDSKLRDYTAQQAFTGVLSASNKSSGEIIPQIPKDNSQLNVLHTKIQQVRQQIAESRNPDKEYLHQVFKPDEIIELEKQYFNQAMPQEYKELIQDFPQLYEQRLANELKAYVKDTDVIQEVSAQLLNDFKDKSFKDTAKHAKLLLFNTLRDKAQELGFKELNINEPSFKVAFGKFQAKLKKGDIQDLSEHIAINSLQHDRLRIQEALNLTPLKEFGTNYAEFYRDGKGAVEKLLAEKQGQVAGAFYKEGLGEIDLVWGDSKKGLSHILERRTQDFINQGLEKGKAEYKVRELLSEIPQILENGKILSQNNDKIELITDKYTLVLGLRDDKKFIVTELIDKRNKKRLEAMQTGVGDSFTDEPLAKTPLSQNQQ
ncbi:PBECR2 nuclease fold domain-containing protein, partial [Campylobacter upsaliensis]